MQNLTGNVTTWNKGIYHSQPNSRRSQSTFSLVLREFFDWRNWGPVGSRQLFFSYLAPDWSNCRLRTWRLIGQLLREKTDCVYKPSVNNKERTVQDAWSSMYEASDFLYSAVSLFCSSGSAFSSCFSFLEHTFRVLCNVQQKARKQKEKDETSVTFQKLFTEIFLLLRKTLL